MYKHEIDSSKLMWDIKAIESNLWKDSGIDFPSKPEFFSEHFKSVLCEEELLDFHIRYLETLPLTSDEKDSAIIDFLNEFLRIHPDTPNLWLYKIRLIMGIYGKNLLKLHEGTIIASKLSRYFHGKGDTEFARAIVSSYRDHFMKYLPDVFNPFCNPDVNIIDFNTDTSFLDFFIGCYYIDKDTSKYDEIDSIIGLNPIADTLDSESYYSKLIPNYRILREALFKGK